MWYEFKPYVSVSDRRSKAQRAASRLQKQGRALSPVTLQGKTIAQTFWGKSWCRNLEHYADFAYRLARGRSYVRHGAVIDLRIESGQVHALVSGSQIYEVVIKIALLSPASWKVICRDCAGGVDSLVELLQGRFSKAVMERLCRPQTGMFPAPKEIEFSCSCPDWASMCKHVAAALYGIGARLDNAPELLFELRQVDEADLITTAGTGVPLSEKCPPTDRVLTADNLSELFGLDLADSVADEAVELSKKKAASSASPKSRRVMAEEVPNVAASKAMTKAKPKTQAKLQTKVKRTPRKLAKKKGRLGARRAQDKSPATPAPTASSPRRRPSR